MNPREQFEQETGKKATLAELGLPDDYSTPYVQWLEAKVQETPRKLNTDAEYQEVREEIQSMFTRLWKFEPEKADLMTCQILNGFEREGFEIIRKGEQAKLQGQPPGISPEEIERAREQGYAAGWQDGADHIASIA